MIMACQIQLGMFLTVTSDINHAICWLSIESMLSLSLPLLHPKILKC